MGGRGEGLTKLSPRSRNGIIGWGGGGYMYFYQIDIIPKEEGCCVHSSAQHVCVLRLLAM